MVKKKIIRERVSRLFVLLALVLPISVVTIAGVYLSTVQIIAVGKVKTVGVEVYQYELVNNNYVPLSSINWGSLSPGTSTSIYAWIKNVGNSQVTLSIGTSDWNPPVANQYMILTWDKQNAVINPNQIVLAKFTLSVSESIKDVTTFSFTIIVKGESP